MDITAIFRGNDGLIRSGWRFALFVAGFIFSAAGLLTVVAIVFGAVMGESATASTAFQIAQGFAFFIPALVVGWLCLRYLEGRPFSALGASLSNGWWNRFFTGVAVGALTLTLAVVIAAVTGGLSFAFDQADLSAVGRTLFLSFVVFTAGAAGEEILFRGYPMQTFFHSRLTTFGIVFGSVLFATAHVNNPSADILSWLNTFLAGIWFAVAYWKTGDLWLPFGMHLMWNWMQGAFYGIAVSGRTYVTSAPLLKEIDRGPAWLTGETYGIEAGLACTIAIVISTAAIYLWPASRKCDVNLVSTET